MTGTDSRDPRAQPVIVIGGYGVFGKHVCRELAKKGLRLTVAGRNSAAAKQFAQELGPKHIGCGLDVRDEVACDAAIRNHVVTVLCAGPFHQFGPVVLKACLNQRSHYVDICDNRQYAGVVQSYEEDFRDRGLSAIYGCSSFPSISGAAACLALRRLEDQPTHARTTLFIGNRNPKGQGAVSSAMSLLGKHITTPSGTVVGFCDGVNVQLPPPFGKRRVLNFDSPDYEILPVLTGVKQVSVKVGFESRIATRAFGFFASQSPTLGKWLLPMLSPLAAILPGGHSCGVVMTELFSASASACVAVHGKNGGQRMAALPCAYAVSDLIHGHGNGNESRPACGTALDLLGADRLLSSLQDDGFLVTEDYFPAL